jgi:quercetin dioxygenase-like cupin family protein
MSAPLGLRDDAFLRDLLELEESENLPGHGLVQLTQALAEVPPAPGARDRLLAGLPATGRFARFAEATAKLLDLGIEQAKALLDRLEDESLFQQELPGVAFFWCEGGPAVANAVRGFVRVEAGTRFPEHEHIGEERVLVLQGSFVDEARGLTFNAGDSDVMFAGTTHEFYVPAGGPDLLKLSVTQAGLRALGHEYLPRT